MAFDNTQASYMSLRDIIAERTTGTVFWIGSGPSVDAGLPTWSQLRDNLVQVLERKIHGLECAERQPLAESLERAASQQNHWRALQELSQALGRTTWRSSIRDILSTSDAIAAPSVYHKIWALKPNGLLTLNLDRLAAKAYAEVGSGVPLTEFAGKQVADYTHVLKNPHPFLCQLHGSIDDASSWTMTMADLKRQLENRAYRNFITSCLSTKTVVFLGINADDQAVGGFFEQLSRHKIDMGSHYWITDRTDFATDRWAEDQGIQLIRYRVSKSDHSQLEEMLDDMQTFLSVDDPNDVTPVNPIALRPSPQSLPSNADLLRMDEEAVRQALNGEASRILQNSSKEAIQDYQRFSEDYDHAIYRAWYTSVELGHNRLLGNTLLEEKASGAFGTVYLAIDPDGDNVAVKVLHEGIRRNSGLLQAFRRGVRSMQILGHSRVEGMVPYKQAFEIPTCVVMDWVDGPSLYEAISANQISDWELILRIGSDVADIVRRGHMLPERVLHRDIRPSNIMLRGFYSNPDEWDVVVLDFDLSWHKGALERSVIHGSTTFGYLAPEQIQELSDISTRHAAVDSFGIGMVLFFMVGQRNPVPDQHRHSDWQQTLKEITGSRPCAKWRSVPPRFARLIAYATQDRQADRWDMTQIQAELGRLYQALCCPESIDSMELIAEEIVNRCEFCEGYIWDENALSAVKQLASGVRFELLGDESQRKIVAKLSWGDPGVQGKAYLDKRISSRRNAARDILKSSGWHIEDSHSRYAHIEISASRVVEAGSLDIDDIAESLDRALQQLRF